MRRQHHVSRPSWALPLAYRATPYILLQAITAECHEKATSLVLESVTQGCSAWLQFEPEVLAMSVLLLAIGTTSSRQDLLNRVSLDGRPQGSNLQRAG